MMIQDRDAGRRFFVEVWQKYHAAEQLQALEALVLGIILQHPEYHDMLGRENESLESEFTAEMGVTNPFLHMGMHIALKEQVDTDRPAGIKAVYQSLLKKSHNAHELEHRIMECLGESLWLAQKNNIMPDENAYMESVRKLR